MLPIVRRAYPQQNIPPPHSPFHIITDQQRHKSKPYMDSFIKLRSLSFMQRLIHPAYLSSEHVSDWTNSVSDHARCAGQHARPSRFSSHLPELNLFQTFYPPTQPAILRCNAHSKRSTNTVHHKLSIRISPNYLPTYSTSDPPSNILQIPNKSNTIIPFSTNTQRH